VWIDEVIAKRYFPGENPIGKWIMHGGFDSTEPKQVVAGVVNSVHDADLGERASGIVYMPFDQHPQSWMAVAVKTTLPFEQILPAMRREIASVDKQLPLSNTKSLATIIDESVGQEKLTMAVLAAFALVSLLLAAVGVYGVIAYFVAQRSHEIGIRMALGASRGRIINFVTGRVLASATAGVVIGLGVAAGASGLMTKLLYEVGAVDVPTYAVGAIVLLAVAMLAACIPTARATRVSPVSAMRSE
jgi:putative ABC transport system permease protein